MLLNPPWRWTASRASLHQRVSAGWERSRIPRGEGTALSGGRNAGSCWEETTMVAAVKTTMRRETKSCFILLFQSAENCEDFVFEKDTCRSCDRNFLHSKHKLLSNNHS